MRKIVRSLILAFVFLSAPLRAQEEIVQSLPDNLKKPLAAFLSATGWQNGEKLAGSTKYWLLTDQIFLLRVADPSTCDSEGDLCLTIIGGMRNGGFVSEAVFYAGGEVKAANNSFALGGADGPSLFFVRFFGKKQSVIAMPAPTGWIVIPTGTIDDFKGPKKN